LPDTTFFEKTSIFLACSHIISGSR
jgi:hypothetical protein